MFRRRKKILIISDDSAKGSIANACFNSVTYGINDITVIKNVRIEYDSEKTDEEHFWSLSDGTIIFNAAAYEKAVYCGGTDIAKRKAQKELKEIMK